jgi:hypothetical protein
LTILAICCNLQIPQSSCFGVACTDFRNRLFYQKGLQVHHSQNREKIQIADGRHELTIVPRNRGGALHSLQRMKDTSSDNDQNRRKKWFQESGQGKRDAMKALAEETKSEPSRQTVYRSVSQAGLKSAAGPASNAGFKSCIILT